MSRDAAWLTLVGLGAYHGLNPAMGWLFAVSRGMQERSRRAVVRSLVPIAIGHELSIALVAALVAGLSVLTDSSTLRIGAAFVLLAFGIFRFARPRAHFRWTSMRVSDRELTLWSFLMSTAHGAGLMVAPVLIGLQDTVDRAHVRAHEQAELGLLGGSLGAGAAGVVLHVVAMLVVMGLVAVVVYDRLGLKILRRAWLNTDQVWAGAFVLAAAITLAS
ncbi:MAG TPA: hypothetical protein VHF51_10155 [Solirubrobacteraceae bacterium]|nr:hypothetical protein [Solirubrobacteraceae bacterium]